MSYQSTCLRLENWAEWNFRDDINLGFSHTAFERFAKPNEVFEELGYSESKRFPVNDADAVIIHETIKKLPYDMYAMLHSFYLKNNKIYKEAKIFGINEKKYSEFLDEAINALDEILEKRTKKVLTPA